MNRKQKLKNYISAEMNRCEEIIGDYENSITEDEDDMKIAEAKLESLVDVMDIMNWDIR